MRAILKFAIPNEKWVIDIETDDGDILPVGKIIDEEIHLFKVSEWDTKELAEEWIKSKGLRLGGVNMFIISKQAEMAVDPSTGEFVEVRITTIDAQLDKFDIAESFKISPEYVEEV